MQSRAVKKLRQWFLSQRRDLPWRDEPTPYAVWVSEIMLQQTQVSVVVPYFERWMRRFPTIEALAKAPIEAVLKEWEGLGYYARARNLHAGACYVVEHYDGKLPASAEQLKKIKGIGNYTVGAILSFAFHQRAAAVDGNVMRVLARYYCLEEDICTGKTQKKIQGLATELLPEEQPWVIGEALIELGATVCAKVAKCGVCPLSDSCLAFSKGMAEQLPIKSGKTAVQSLYRLVSVVVCGERFLVGRGEMGKVMADLFEFPYFEVGHAELGVEEQKKFISEELKETFALKVSWKQALPSVKHSFTRYRALLMPHFFSVKETKKVEGYEWLSVDEMQQHPFSSGHRRIFSSIQEIIKQ